MCRSPIFVVLMFAAAVTARADETQVDSNPSPKQAIALDGYTPAPRVVVQAKTLAGLIAATQPAIVSKADMIWATRDPHGQLAFTFATAAWVRLANGRSAWAVLRHGDSQEMERDHNGIATSDFSDVAIRNLAPNKSHADAGDGDYARLLLRRGGYDLYEIGVENMSLGSGHWTEQRRLYVLHGPGDDAWQFVGEGPAEISGKSGPLWSSSTTAARARLTGDAKAPVFIEFTTTSSRDLTGEEAKPARPSLTIRREALLDGPLPAPLRWLSDPYVLAGNDAATLDAIIAQYTYWEINGADEEFAKSHEREAAAFRHLVLARNPAVSRGGLPSNTIVYLPTREELLEHRQGGSK